MTLTEKLNEQITLKIKMIIRRYLNITSNQTINTNQLIGKLDCLPFVDLGQLDEIRYKLDEYSDEYISNNYPNITKALGNTMEHLRVADAIWIILYDKDSIYGLSDENDSDAALERLFSDVEEYLK